MVCIIDEKHLHVGIIGIESFVEVVHLDENADDRDDPKHVCAWMRELVVPGKRQLDGDAEAFNGHNGDGTHGGAYRDVDGGIRPTVSRNNGVNHDKREHGNSEAIHHKA